MCSISSYYQFVILMLQFGGVACVVILSTETVLTCLSPSHAQGEVEVSVTVAGKGKASGMALFTYNLQLSSVSHCSG